MSTRHVTINRHFKKRSKAKAIAQKPLVFFAQSKKVHSRTMLFFLKSGKENKYSKCCPFLTGQGRKVSLVKYFFRSCAAEFEFFRQKSRASTAWTTTAPQHHQIYCWHFKTVKAAVQFSPGFKVKVVQIKQLSRPWVQQSSFSPMQQVILIQDLVTVKKYGAIIPSLLFTSILLLAKESVKNTL